MRIRITLYIQKRDSMNLVFISEERKDNIVSQIITNYIKIY
jgi:hypothetical protein